MGLSNESYFSLNFLAIKARPNKEGEIPIALRITMNVCCKNKKMLHNYHNTLFHPYHNFDMS